MRSFIVLTIGLLLPACISTYGAPAPVAPLLDEAGDVAVSASMRALQPSEGANAYIAAAPSKSTRVFVSGSKVREHGGHGDDRSGRTLTERNHTNEIDAGAGYGFAYKKLVVAEALGGFGYGRTRAAQCYDQTTHWATQGNGWCRFWADSKSWFVRPFLQGEAAVHIGMWQGGGGVRASLLRYQLEELFDRPSERVLWVPTLEPFMVQRVGFDWGKLELGIQAPFVLSKGHGRNTQLSHTDAGDVERSASGPMVVSPVVRATLGVVINLDEGWRKRDR